MNGEFESVFKVHPRDVEEIEATFKTMRCGNSLILL